jgi:hypothetical protein
MDVTSDVGVTGEEKRREMRGEAGSNNSFNRSRNSSNVIENLDVFVGVSGPVNSSVRHASHKQKSRGLSNVSRKSECKR